MMAGMARGGGIRWLAVGVLAVVAGVLVLGTRLTADQLSTADQVASVVAAVVAVLGVPIAVYGVVLARRGAGPADPPLGGDLQQKVRSGRDANVAGGDLHIGRGRGRRRSGPPSGTKVRQDVNAQRDANVAGGDLHVERGREQR